MNRDDETHHALQTLGQSIGVISLGKKLVLIEGHESSLDKQTYGSILKGRFPEFVLVPVGGKDTIRSFEDVQRSVIDKTIWGVEFFLLCDRDAVSALGRSAIEKSSSSRIKQLPRYHLENYFLDENVLADILARMESEDSWMRDPSSIRTRLRQIASSVVSYAVALNVNSLIREHVGNVSIVPRAIDTTNSAEDLISRMVARVAAERDRITAALDEAVIRELVMKEYARLLDAIANDSPEWKSDIPGRVILHKFAAMIALQPGRLKQMYLGSSIASNSFSDIVRIFDEFRGATRDVSVYSADAPTPNS